MKKFVVSVALVACSALAWALPSLQEVEAQVQQGHYAQAESMMREVVAAKPNSARAHYIYAEILAHDGSFARAADEARLARQIDPDVKFAAPEKFSAFEALLQRQQAQAAPARVAPAREAFTPAARAALAPAAASAGIPSWVWLAGLAAIAFVLWRGFSRSRGAVGPTGAVGAPGSYAAPPYSPNGPNAVGPAGMPYGAGYPAARPSSGMMGVGLAAAGGLAAGVLADEMLHRHRDQGLVDPDAGGRGGFFDSPQGGSAASDLESRPVDFGNGGADWDAGSSDAGGGGSDGGGGWD